MRLKKLKLVGFKSFIDATTVLFPSKLVAVVGPNGCGKSNIIDAVRWVMGESSAKNLRGDSMADVIFNGSTQRKPVGQASVELVFENDKGRLLGEYAAYSEISVKRVVTREGLSTYFLNNTKCRRKDVTDIFLGTGLGARSYSIIGQGTVSRIIEAKPEELRVFLEEAAGIAKYKERRRETANRIKHTRENLERVDDIREELAHQLERLQRQAKAAEKYKALKLEEKTLKAQLSALRWQSFNEQLEHFNKIIHEQQLAIEKKQTEQTQLGLKIEKERANLNDVNDEFNKMQARYYQLGAEIARIEEALAHQKERREQLEEDLSQAKADWQSAKVHGESLHNTYVDIEQNIAELKPEVEQLRTQVAAVNGELFAVESEKEDWQSQWDSFNQEAHESSKIAHVEQSRIQQLEIQIQQIEVRLEKLQQEKETIESSMVSDELNTLKKEVQALNEALALKLEEKENASGAIKQQKMLCQEKENALQKAKEQLAELNAKKLSLEALQQAALGKQNQVISQWLTKEGLADNKRLAECIQVASGWERAIEVVLSDSLQAVCVDDCVTLSTILASFSEGSLCFIDTTSSLTAGVTQNKMPLYEKVNSSFAAVKNQLSGIYAAENLQQALTWLPDIGAHESIVTACGIHLGHGFLRVHKEVDESVGILAREKELKRCVSDCEQAVSLVDKLNEEKNQSTEAFIRLEEKLDGLVQVLNNLHTDVADMRARLKVNNERLTQANARMETLDDDMHELVQTIQDKKEELVLARDNWQQAMSAMEGDTQKRESLIASREAINQSLDSLKTKQSQLRDFLHEKELAFKTKQAEKEHLLGQLEREKARIEASLNRTEQLTEALVEANRALGVVAEEELEEKLTMHIDAEAQMAETKAAVESVKQDLAKAESLRLEIEQELRTLQVRCDEKRMEAQTLRVRCSTVEEALAEEAQSLETLIAALPEEATEKAWDEALQAVLIRIGRLGAINLAAIDEYETESERKRYLDEQHNDLSEALTTLEAAINKIDKETRTRFKETYDEVNEGFQRLFPRLFGGGQAYLALTDDDLLETGVTVMARPPGKRNSTIHLLSGGEKAMTAIALVFAIFQLNPSPFCLLDEVDAPLDDSNVGRFCSMVKEMSEHIQFIFITHNKVTMELATHLSGVTMHEPGVSRIVSVDVDEALSIAE